MKERPLITGMPYMLVSYLDDDCCIYYYYYYYYHHFKIRKEFHSLIGSEELSSSLKGNWHVWMERIVKVAERESLTRPAIQKLLDIKSNVDSADSKYYLNAEWAIVIIAYADN